MLITENTNFGVWLASIGTAFTPSFMKINLFIQKMNERHTDNMAIS
jgi:hypothetical protein